MSKFYKWLETWLPGVWATLGVFTITGVLIGTSIKSVLWILELLGVL